MQSNKPEYVLKRANDIINSAIGGSAEKEKKLALSLLHNVIGGKKRNGQWSKTYETIMKRHLELCVDLKDYRTAKDGLHQYRNLCQTVDPNSLETVIIQLMDLAESRATAARQKADRVALAAAAKVADLEQEETPESIMLSSMTEEVAKDRTDREVVVPWLKFLWETYRAILELLHKNAKLEKVYHKTCEKAFKFCLDYHRTLEFRRLGEMLRQQFSILQKMSTTPARANRISWEWTPEAVELHLHTRFVQLEVATSLELWNEGFQTVEDIYEIIVINRKTPKPKLMATYYEKLTRIFWVSENQLFHAYAWFKFYSLSLDSRKDLKAEEKSVLASAVLLSALSIPSSRDTTDPSALVEEDEIATDKNQQMAKLLDFQANPTRKALLEEIISRGVLNDVLPEVASLYYALETKFNPLGLVKALAPKLAALKSQPQLACYAIPIENVAVVRIVQQLSRVYSVVKMDFLQRLLSGLEDISFNTVEKIIIDGIARKQLQLRIDHRLGVVRFGASTASTAGNVEGQVAQLGATLNKVAHDLSVTLGAAALEEASAASRKEFFAKVVDASDKLHFTALDRKMQIERRKEELEKAQHEKQENERRIQEIEDERRKRQEADRIAAEERRREEDKLRKLKEQQDLIRLQKELERYGVVLTTDELQERDPDARRNLLEQAKSEAAKAKEEEGRRVTDQAKRLDHITRALRIEGAEAISAKYQVQLEQDRQAYEAKLVVLDDANKKQHEVDLVEKERLTRMQPLRVAFEEALLAGQRAAYKQKLAKLKEKALQDFRERKVAKARRLRREEEDRLEYEAELEQEQIRKEEEAAIERQVAEDLRVRRQAEEEEERTREAQREERVRKERESAPPAASAPTGGDREDRGESEWRGSGGAAKSGLDRFSARPPAGREEGAGGGWSSRPPRQQAAGESDWGRRAAPADRPERPDFPERGAERSDRPERGAERSDRPEPSTWRGSSARGGGGDRDGAAPAAAPSRNLDDWGRGGAGRSGGGGGDRDTRDRGDAPAPTRNLDDWGRGGGGGGGAPRRDGGRDGGRDFGRSGGDRDGGRDFGRSGGDRDGGRDFGRSGGDRDGGRDFGRSGGDRDGGRDFGRSGGDRDGGRDRESGGGEGGGAWRRPGTAGGAGGAGGGARDDAPKNVRFGAGAGGAPEEGSWRRK